MLPALIPIFKIVASMIAQKALSKGQEPAAEPTGPVTPPLFTGTEDMSLAPRQAGFRQGLGLF